MTPKDKNENVITPRPHEEQIVADPNAAPVSLAEILSQMGMGGRRVQSKELVGRTLDIIRAKPFASSFDESREAWFVVCRDVETGEQLTTVLGGGAVVEILEAYAATGSNKPFRVTLEWVEGGKFGGYYQLA